MAVFMTKFIWIALTFRVSALGREGGGRLLQLMAHHQLIATLHRDLWAYAGMMLSEGARRSLEESCRKLGVTVSRLGPPAPISAPAFCSVVKAARAQEGEEFLHHAGYFAGSNAARRVEGNLPEPNSGAERLAAEAAAAFTDLTIQARAPSAARFEISINARQPLDRGAVAYVHGFVKGAATRLNEGSPPVLTETHGEGGRMWGITVDWVEGRARKTKDEGKTRRR